LKNNKKPLLCAEVATTPNQQLKTNDAWN